MKRDSTANRWMPAGWAMQGRWRSIPSNFPLSTRPSRPPMRRLPRPAGWWKSMPGTRTRERGPLPWTEGWWIGPWSEPRSTSSPGPGLQEKSEIARRRSSPLPTRCIQIHQDLTPIHLISRATVQFDHPGLLRRGDPDLHLHRLEDDQRLAPPNRLSRYHRHPPDESGHGCFQPMLVLLGRPRREGVELLQTITLALTGQVQ